MAKNHDSLKKVGTLIFIGALALTLLVSCNPPIDKSKAQVTFKHTIKLPGGFSIESSVPLDLNKLNQVGTKNPSKIYETEKFSLPIEIKNDNKRHTDTKIKLEYSHNNIDFLYLYAADGQPLVELSDSIYEFDKDVLPLVPTTLYVAGVTKEIPPDYPYVGIDFKLTYLDGENVPLATNTHRIEVYKINYTVSSNTSS